MKYFRQLDGLRFLAILFVLIEHWMKPSIKDPFLKNLPFGTGVTLFFVISGFLITRILIDFRLENEKNGRSNWYSIRSFYMRRTLRIFPIYYLTIFFLLAIGFQHTREIFGWLISYSLNVKIALTNEYPGSFTHFWSLAVEEQFYIFWAFLMVFLPKKYLKTLIVLSITISVVLRFYLVYFTPWWGAGNGLVFTNMHSLGLGALGAYEMSLGKGFDRYITLFRKWWIYLLILYLAVFAIPYNGVFFEKLRHFSDPVLSVIYFFMVIIAVHGAFTCGMKNFLEHKVVVYMGKISYGLYVYHLFMGPLYFNFLNQHLYLPFIKTDWQFGMLFLLINLLISTLSWYLIEKPVIGLKRYFNY